MNQEELKQRLVELALTDIECDKDGHGDCSMCEYRCDDDKCAKYYSGVMVDFFIKNGVTIREWIPVTERLPDIDQCVLCSRGYLMNTYVYMGGDKWEDDYGYYGTTEEEGITHWMPLPLPPETEKGGVQE